MLSEKIFLNEKTPHSHPLQVKWSVSNQIQIDELHAEDDLHDHITVRLDEAYLFRRWFIH